MTICLVYYPSWYLAVVISKLILLCTTTSKRHQFLIVITSPICHYRIMNNHLFLIILSSFMLQGQNVIMSRHTVTTSQSQKVIKSQRHNVTTSQRHKVIKSQHHNVTTSHRHIVTYFPKSYRA